MLDLAGDPAHHDLALLMHGNQWMVMESLLDAFRWAYPAVGSVYYETLPPGILIQQLRRGALQIGALTIRVSPDILTAGIEALSRLAQEGWLEDYHEYATNTLSILVSRSNPYGIRSWAGLLQQGVRVALPNPETEGIGRLVREAVTASLGGEAWAELERRSASGQVRFTTIHHRETPLALLAGHIDAGPVWLTEALHQERLGAAVVTVRLSAGENRRGHYGVAIVRRTSLHFDAASALAEFLCGPEGQAVYANYGFERSQVGPLAGNGRAREP